MKLDDNGAAFFVEGLDENDDELPPELATSPLPNINDQEPTWDEAQREAANRSLIKEFEATEEDEVDDASADSNLDMYPLTKSKLNKNKRKKKTRSKHSRSGSKASLKEILIDNAAAAEINAASNKTPVNEETPTKPEPESGSLLLSRIPDSFDVEEQNEEMQEKNKSLPIEIEKRLQYFSEPELSPGTSPMGSRPGSPVMSDTEYEIRDRSSSARNSLPGSKKDSNASEQSWEWGQFPQNTPQHTSEDKKVKKSQTVDETAAQNKSGWEISSYFFGGKKESSNKAQEAQGVYLDDLKDVDEEMLSLHSVEGAIGFHHSDNGGVSTYHIESEIEKRLQYFSEPSSSRPDSPVISDTERPWPISGIFGFQSHFENCTLGNKSHNSYILAVS